MTFEVGQKAWVFNQSGAGLFVIEGQAKIITAVDRASDRFLVDFDDGYGPVERFLDQNGQADPQAHVRWLNEVS